MKEVNRRIEGPSLNRLVNRMLLEALSIAESKPFSALSVAPVLFELRYRSVRPLFADVAEIDVTKVLKVEDACVLNLASTAGQREKLASFAAALNWSTAQVAAEAIHTFSILADGCDGLEELPRLFRNWRAIENYRFGGELERDALDKLNRELAIPAKKARMEFKSEPAGKTALDLI